MSNEIDMKALRELCGWTQDQMARYLGIGKAHVVRLEAGRRQPSGPVKRLLELLWEEGNPDERIAK